MMGNSELDFLADGFQYLGAARHAYRCGFMPVAGNLFHHAFEMICKAKLLDAGRTVDQLSKRPYRHDLFHIWTDFKSVTQATNLASYDHLIADLHAFDTIRYPNFPKGHSVIMVGDQGLSVASSTASVAMTPSGPVASNATIYRVSLEAMDLLLKDTVAAYPLNPDFVKTTLFPTPEALRTYLHCNQHAI
jgi:hypothetical protein